MANSNVLTLFLAFAIPLLIYAAPHLGQKGLISNLDFGLPFWLYLIQIAFGLWLAVSLAKDFKEWFLKVINGKRLESIIPIAVVAALAIFVCVAWIVPRHRVQSDESIFLSTAQNMYANQIAGSCNEGEFSESGHLNCLKSVHNFKAKGESFLYSVGIPIFGRDLRWVFPLHIFMLFATIFLLYFAIRAWTDNNNLAFLTAAIFAAQPTTLFQFRSASVEPLYVMLFALNIFLFKWVWDKNTQKHWLLLALSLAFFAQTRQETIFCLGAFVIPSAFKMLPKLKKQNNNLFPSIFNPQFSIFLLTISIFCIPILLTISYYQGYNFQGGEFNAHGHFIDNIKQAWNITVNTPPDNKGLLKYPFLSSFSILALCGFVLLIIFAWNEFQQKKKRFHVSILIFLLLYFPQFFMIFENVSGDLSIEINQRYTLIIFPLMAFLSAFAIDKASCLLTEKHRLFFVLACAAILWGNTLSYSESFKANIMYNRNHLTTEEVEILKWVNNEPPKKRIFIYSRPGHFIGYGMNSIHYNSLNQQKLSELLQKYDGEVYYVRGLDCWDSQTYHKKAIEHRIANVCDGFERQFPSDLVFSTIITNNYRVVIAKLKESGVSTLFAPQEVNVELPENAQWLGVPSEHRQDWGNLQIDKSVTGKPLTIAKKRYKKGIGTHANGTLRYNLDSKYERLTAVIGLDEDEFCSNGIQIKIFGDGNLLANTGKLGQGEEYSLDIPLSGVKQLIFEMDGMGDIGCDHVDIALPMVMTKRLAVE